MSRGLFWSLSRAGAGLSFPTENLVSYWPMNGSGEDIGGGGNQAFINGTITFPSGKNELCASLDGSTGFFNVLDSSNLSFGNGTTDSPFSVSFWINVNAAPSVNAWLFAKRGASNREYQVTISSSRTIGFALFSQNNASNFLYKQGSTVLSLSTWYHVTVTYDGSSSYSGLKIYINGVEDVGTNSSSGTYVAMNNTSNQLFFGAWNNSGFYNGLIDEISLFSSQLSQSTINSIYNNGSGRFYSNV